MISDERIMKFVIPQGSVLSPTFFNIYEKYVFSLKCNGQVIAFADDTEADSWYSLKLKTENILKELKSG